MSRLLVTPTGERVDLAAPGAADALARIIVDLGGQLEQARTEAAKAHPPAVDTARVDQLERENAALERRLETAQEARNLAQEQARQARERSNDRKEALRSLEAQVAAQTKRADALAATLAEQRRAATVSGGPTEDMSDGERLRLFLAELRRRLLAEASRHPSTSVSVGLRLAAREIGTFSTQVGQERGAA